MKAVIVPQGKHEENCRQLTNVCTTNAAGDPVTFPIKFPCLRIQLDAGGNKFVVTWSHFHHDVKLGPNKGQPNVSEHPGKFKLRHVDMRRPMLYERNHNGLKMTDRRGRNVFDFMTMSRDWGTEAVYDKGQYTWSYGEDHPMIEETIWDEEYETLESLNEAIAKRFDNELADTVVLEFMSHELYQTYDTTLQTAAA